MWVHLAYWVWVLVLFSPTPLLFIIILTVLNINGQLAHSTRFLLILYMPQICLEKENQSKYFLLSQQFELTVFHGLHAGKVHYSRHKYNLHFIFFFLVVTKTTQHVVLIASATRTSVKRTKHNLQNEVFVFVLFMWTILSLQNNTNNIILAQSKQLSHLLVTGENVWE